MEQLRKAIESQGIGIGQDVVKVDMFLNHRIDTALLFAMGEAWAEEFRAEKPTVVLTVEASGIAMAVAAMRWGTSLWCLPRKAPRWCRTKRWFRLRYTPLPIRPGT